MEEPCSTELEVTCSSNALVLQITWKKGIAFALQIVTLLGKVCLEFRTFLPTGRLSRGFGIAMTPPPTPLHNNPAGRQHCFFFGRGGGGGVFVIASALKGSLLKEYIVKSIFVQACRPSLGADERLVFV